MTTPDLEGLAREHEEKADFHGNEANIWSQPGKMSAFRQQRASEEGALAQAHRQAAALIRSAPAPGREEISNEIHIALQRLHYADLSWIAGSADGFERATLAIADHLLSALFPAQPPSGWPKASKPMTDVADFLAAQPPSLTFSDEQPPTSQGEGRGE